MLPWLQRRWRSPSLQFFLCIFTTHYSTVWYGMVNVDLYSAIITKVSNALNTLVSGEKPGFQTLPKGLVVLLCAEVVRQRVPDHGPCIALFHHRRPLYAWNLASNFFTRLDQLTHYVATLNYLIRHVRSVGQTSFGETSGYVRETPKSAWQRGRATQGRAFQFGQKKFRIDSILATESIFSIRFGNLINLPLVHWYSNSKLGVIFIVCIA